MSAVNLSASIEQLRRGLQIPPAINANKRTRS